MTYRILTLKFVRFDTGEQYVLTFPGRVAGSDGPATGTALVSRNACKDWLDGALQEESIDGFQSLIGDEQRVTYMLRQDADGGEVSVLGDTYASAAIQVGPETCVSLYFSLGQQEEHSISTADTATEVGDIRQGGMFDQMDAKRRAVRALLGYVRIQRW